MTAKKMGPPHLVIPQRLIDHLESSYETGQDYTIELDPESPDTRQFINTCKLYAKRVNKSFRFSWSDNELTYYLTEKRPYTPRTGLNRG